MMATSCLVVCGGRRGVLEGALCLVAGELMGRHVLREPGGLGAGASGTDLLVSGAGGRGWFCRCC